MQLVLYHAGCYDGFGAAWAAFKKLGHQILNPGGVREPVEYVPVYHEAPPEIPSGCTHIYLLDIAFTPEIVTAWCKDGREITVLDHHKSALEAYQRDGLMDLLPHERTAMGLYCMFDLSKSGAVLAWHYFHGKNHKPPELLDYIQDRDLWQHALPHSKEIVAWIRSYPMDDFGTFDSLASDLGAALSDNRISDRLISEGRGIIRSEHRLIQQAVDHATIGRFIPRKAEVPAWQNVPVVNATFFHSEIAATLARKHVATAPFAATYFDRHDSKSGHMVRQWSLRSIGSFDVSEVAKAHGGGGHRNAAGFEEPL